MSEREARHRLVDRPADVQAWCDLGQWAKTRGDHGRSLVAYERASTLNPSDASIAGIRRLAISSLVPRWHFRMLHDRQRNDAYARAIRRAVGPARHVLEIGTGSGLLAMLCAQAGARHVTTCEMVPAIAAAARRIVARNGLSDRIRVLTARSQDLEVGRDLPEAGDILVSEIISNDFLSEGVLAAVTDARHRLLNSDATIIPASASVRIALAGGSDLDRFLSAGSYGGLDLGDFDSLRPAVLPIAESCELTPLSEPADAFHFDFSKSTSFGPERRLVSLTATRAGRCYGAVQWMRLNLDAETVFENTPFGGQRSHWEPLLCTFASPTDVGPGDVVRLLAMHDVSSLMITLASITRPAPSPTV